MTEHPMTDATPLASEQITQEDREAAWKYRPACYWLGDDTMEKWMAGVYDTAAPVISDFARHRIAALFATPAPSDQDASQAQGEVVRDQYGNAAYDAFEAACLGIAYPAPGATAQDGVGDMNDYMEAIDASRPRQPPTPTIPAGMVVQVVRECAAVAHRYGYNLSVTAPAHGVTAIDAAARLDAAQTIEADILALLDHRIAAAPKQAEQQGVERMRAALQEIADMPDNLVPTITVQGMRNVAGFALIGGDHAG